jgi:phosphatidylinositol alpha-1,6-mannosyltransferase
MDILLVTQDFPPEEGGIQTYLLEIARRFVARGHAVRVICPAVPGGPSGIRDESPPVAGLKDLARLRSPGSSFLWSRLLTYLPGYLRANPSVERVLYAQWQGAAGALLTPKAGRKEYCLVHGRELLTSVFGPLHGPLLRRAFARLDGAFPNSNEVLRLTKERARPACPLRLVHPGVDPHAFFPVDAGFLRARYGLGDAPVIVSLGRMVARKNLAGLIAALPEVRRAVPGTRLLLGGTGPERAALMERAAALGLAGDVLFPGRIADGEMAAHYSLADAFCLPSLASEKDVEGFGIVYLEAGACEVAEGETGLLVDPRSREELAHALIVLLSDRARGKAMGRRARERVLRDFTWDSCADRMLAWMA